MDAVKVFLSSTWLDLQPERDAIDRCLRRMKATQFVGMEYFGARDSSTAATSLAEVDGSDIYLGVVGHRFGSGITAAEYRRALDRGMPCLIYFKAQPDGIEVPVDEDGRRVSALREEMQARHTVVVFKDADDLAVRVAADLHNAIFDRLLVHGLGHLKADYDARIRRFLAEYLGDAAHPIAFGGRDRELRALDRWLDGRKTAPYALLVGAAGRGKSALLVRWAQRLFTRSNTDVIFFPISIRFRTNLAGVAFASIAARLAALHGERVPGAVDTPAEVWRELVSSYLARPLPEGHSLLLIIDGADEIGDTNIGPDLFPRTPPPGLKILVSARLLVGDVDATGWLERFGWARPGVAEPLQLSPLTPEGLAQVLRDMSVPLEVLSERSDVVAELFRLTEGDPLLVNLYVADLWSRGEQVARLQVADLASIEPGLEGYFKRWWEDQRTLWAAQSPLREPEFNAVLNSLACALGPLMTVELLQLLPKEHALDLWALEDVLDALKRFVIGDGTTQGYAFSHPRLGDYFYERLRAARQAELHEARFVAWGMRCVEALTTQAGETEMPSYVLQFLRRHMERAHCEAKTFQLLVGTTWARAWERLDRGSNAGFLSDLLAVRKIVTDESTEHAAAGILSPFTATELRCALCQASISTLAGDLSAAVLQALVEKGVWSAAHAISYATNIPNPRSRLRTLLELVAVVDDAHRPLGIAAAVAETRALVASDEGRNVLSVVIADLYEGVAPTHTGQQLAALIDGALRVARHLPELRSRWLSKQIAARREALAPAQRLAVDAVLHGHGFEEPRTDHATIIHTLVHGGASPWMADGLQAFVASPELADCELCVKAVIEAALRAASVVACVSSQRRENAIDRALHFLPYLSDKGLTDAADQIGRFLSARQVETFLVNTRGAPTRARIKLIVTLLRALPEEATGTLQQALVESVTDASLSAPELIRALRTAARWLPRQTLLVCISRAHDDLPGDNRIALYESAAFARTEPDVTEDMTRLALETLETPLPTRVHLAALAALVDHLLANGRVDSRESWRVSLEDKVTYRRLRRLLTAASPPAQRLRDVALRVCSLPQVFHSFGRDGLAPSILAAIGESETQVKTSEETSDAARFDAHAGQILERFERLDPRERTQERLVEIMRSLEPRLGSIDGLRLLSRLSASVGADCARSCVAPLLGPDEPLPLAYTELLGILGLVAAGPLFPPTVQTLAAVRLLVERVPHGDMPDLATRALKHGIPDLLRAELLATILRNTTRDASTVAAIMRDIASLAWPPEPLLRAAIASRAERLHGPDNLRLAVCSLDPPRWIRLVGGLPRVDRRRLLGQLADCQPRNALVLWAEIVETVQSLSSENDRTEWILDLVELVEPTHVATLLACARDIRDDGQRLIALAALIPRLPDFDRAAVLTDALKLARRPGTDSRFTRTLVQLAVDLDGGEVLMSEAVATAVSISDRQTRANVLTELASTLTGDALANAIAAFRRIDDIAPRMRAMRALTSAATDHGGLATAGARMAQSILDLRPGDSRNAAAIYVAPLLPEPLRWPILESALEHPPTAIADLPADDLVASLSSALKDAPARIIVLALRWLRGLPANALRARLIGDLMPFVPEGGVPVAIARFAESRQSLSATEFESCLDLIAPRVSQRVIDRLHASDGLHGAQALGVLNEIQRAKSNRPLRRIEPPPDPDEVLTRCAPPWDRRSVSALQAVLARGVRSESVPAFLHLVRSIANVELRIETTRYIGLYDNEAQLEQVCSLILDIASPADRCAVSLRVAAGLDGHRRERMIEIALASAADESDCLARSFASAEIAAREPTRLSEALDVLYTARDTGAKAGALADLLCRLDGSDAARVVATLHRLDDELIEAHLLSSVAPRLEAPGAVSAFERACKCTSAVVRSRVLAALSVRMPNELRPRVEQALEGIATDFAWLELLGAIATRWPDSLTSERARVASQRITGLIHEDDMAEWLMRVVASWPADAWPEFFGAVSQIRDAGTRAAVLSKTLEYCAGAPPHGVLEAIRSVDDGYHRAVTLGQYAAIKADPTLMNEALRLADHALVSARRIDVLVRIVHVANTVPDSLLDKLFVTWTHRPESAAGALTQIARNFSPSQARRVLEAVRIEARLSPQAAADLLFALAAHIEPAELGQILDVAEQRCTERLLCGLLVDLADWFESGSSAPKAAAAALRMRSGTYRAESLCGLFHRLGPEDREDALTSLRAIPNRFERARRLAQIGIVENGPIVEAAAPALTSPVDDARSAIQTPATLLRALLDEASSRAAKTRAPVEPARTLERRGRTRLLRHLRSLECENDRYVAITRALPEMPANELRALVSDLPRFLTEIHEADVLGRIAPLLAASAGDVLLVSAMQLTQAKARAHALRRVIPHLGKNWKSVLHNKWQVRLKELSRGNRRDLFAEIESNAPVIAALGGDGGILEAIDVLDDIGRSWP